MAEETKVEETKPEEPKDEKPEEPAADESKDEKSDEPKDEEPEAEPEAEAVEPAEEMGAMAVGAQQPPAVPDTVFVPAAFARDGVTALKNTGAQYTRADHFGRAAILHSDRLNSGALGARPTYTDRMLVDGDLSFVPVVGSGANNPPR